jgi:hypothetical protein
MYNNSDHRGMFIDISEALIDDKVELRKPVKLQIGTDCSHHDIFKYKKYIDTQFKIHRIYDKIHAFTASTAPEHMKLKLLSTKSTTLSPKSC